MNKHLITHKIDSLGVWPTMQCFSCPGCNGSVYFGNDRYICCNCGLPISLWFAQKLTKNWRKNYFLNHIPGNCNICEVNPSDYYMEVTDYGYTEEFYPLLYGDGWALVCKVCKQKMNTREEDINEIQERNVTRSIL